MALHTAEFGKLINGWLDFSRETYESIFFLNPDVTATHTLPCFTHITILSLGQNKRNSNYTSYSDLVLSPPQNTSHTSLD